MSDSDNERKRKAGEIDTTAVAPKKKLAAQAALAAAEAAEKDNAGAAKAGGSASSVAVKSENGKPSWSIEVTAPSGANAADSEEVLKFQNERMYAALEAKKHEVARLQAALDKHEETDKGHREVIACVTRHWCALTEELKSTFLRLEHSPASIDTALPSTLIEQLSALKGVVPEKAEAAMVKSCQAAQELIQEVVQSLMDNNVQLKAVMNKLESISGGDDVKAEVEKAKKRLDTLSKDLDKMQDTHREYVVEEGSKTDDFRTQAARAAELLQENEALRRQMEQAEKRLVLSEQNLKAARQAGGSNGLAAGIESGGDLSHEQLEYKYQAEHRLEEIKSLQKQIFQLQEQQIATTHAPQEMSESMITQSQAYIGLSEQLKLVKKECETYHMTKISQLTLELAQEKEKQQAERRMIENQSNQQVQQLLKLLQIDRNKVDLAKQEVRSLQFKLDQKSVGEISTKRAEELNETLQKVQAEYTRLRKDNEALRARPDAEELRREFREEKEKLWKERDTEMHRAADLADQLKEKDKKIEALMAAPKGDGANGVTGVEKEIAGLKKDVERFREEKRDLQRRLQKADRGFNECTKLYQQFKKEREETMKDLESLGHSFEEMQEQNTRLLQTMKQKDEDYNDLLRERIKERQQREMLADEKGAIKMKLEKTEELLKAREDVIEMCKKELENAQLEQVKKSKEEECSAAIVTEHRKMLQVREVQAKEARRDVEKARATIAELQKGKQEADKELQEMKFERSRLQEEMKALERRLAQAERQGGGGGAGGSLDSRSMDLLKHYRSCVKCHCNDTDAIKERVLPCGHASCKKCIEKLIQGRSRKCPQCSSRFDQSDVKPLHLQSSLGDV